MKSRIRIIRQGRETIRSEIVKEFEKLYLTFDDLKKISDDYFKRKVQENKAKQRALIAKMNEAEYAELLNTDHSPQGKAAIIEMRKAAERK